MLSRSSPSVKWMTSPFQLSATCSWPGVFKVQPSWMTLPHASSNLLMSLAQFCRTLSSWALGPLPPGSPQTVLPEAVLVELIGRRGLLFNPWFHLTLSLSPLAYDRYQFRLLDFDFQGSQAASVFWLLLVGHLLRNRKVERQDSEQRSLKEIRLLPA